MLPYSTTRTALMQSATFEITIKFWLRSEDWKQLRSVGPSTISCCRTSFNRPHKKL
jgi:hypothetical protein